MHGIPVRTGLVLLVLGAAFAAAQEPPAGADRVLRIGVNRDYEGKLYDYFGRPYYW